MPPHDTTPAERPLHVTGNRIVDQFAHMMPTANLTLIGILQGLVLGALLTHAQPPASFVWQDIRHALLVHDGYLTFIASFLVIVLVWDQYIYAFFIIHWPLRSFWSALQFLLVIPEFAMVASVNSVGAWSFWAGVAGLIGALLRFGNQWVSSPSLFRLPGETDVPIMHQQIIQAYSRGWEMTQRLYACIFLVAGYLREVGQHPLDAAIRLPSGTSIVIFDVVVPLGMIVGTVADLRIDDAHFARVTEHILRAYRMPYRVTAKGILEERSLDEREEQTRSGGEAAPLVAGADTSVQQMPKGWRWRRGEPDVSV